MNENIKELISKAQKEVWVSNAYNGSPEFDGYELDAEKLAELIIKECINIVQAQKGYLTENMVYWNDHDYGYEMAINDAVDVVKIQFGVE